MFDSLKMQPVCTVQIINMNKCTKMKNKLRR